MHAHAQKGISLDRHKNFSPSQNSVGNNKGSFLRDLLNIIRGRNVIEGKAIELFLLSLSQAYHTECMEKGHCLKINLWHVVVT